MNPASGRSSSSACNGCKSCTTCSSTTRTHDLRVAWTGSSERNKTWQTNMEHDHGSSAQPLLLPPLRMTACKYLCSVRPSTHAAMLPALQRLLEITTTGLDLAGEIICVHPSGSCCAVVVVVVVVCQRNNRQRRTNDGGLRALSRSGIWIVPRGSSPTTLLFPSRKPKECSIAHVPSLPQNTRWTSCVQRPCAAW